MVWVWSAEICSFVNVRLSCNLNDLEDWSNITCFELLRASRLKHFRCVAYLQIGSNLLDLWFLVILHVEEPLVNLRPWKPSPLLCLFSNFCIPYSSQLIIECLQITHLVFALPLSIGLVVLLLWSSGLIRPMLAHALSRNFLRILAQEIVAEIQATDRMSWLNAQRGVWLRYDIKVLIILLLKEFWWLLMLFVENLLILELLFLEKVHLALVKLVMRVIQKFWAIKHFLTVFHQSDLVIVSRHCCKLDCFKCSACILFDALIFVQTKTF